MSLERTSFPDTSLLEFSVLILQCVQIDYSLHVSVKLNLEAFFYYSLTLDSRLFKTPCLFLSYFLILLEYTFN